ncbi:MAG: UDP-N-acetylmuramoyl-tripeptide--D-alanyl-D-alanine ligase [Mariprofundus sp.]
MQQATGGVWHNGMVEQVDAITTDTRGFAAGNCFLALRGPNFDGHRFGAQVADRASLLIGDGDGCSQWAALDVPQLQVEDTLHALGDLALAWRKQLTRTTVVAISGSYGKTSVRSMLQHVLTILGVNVAATRANLNNLIGVPKTLLSVPDDADVALIECGVSEAGEMARLSAIVQADVALLTGITSAHSEGLGGLAGVVNEKADLFTAMNKDGWCALGAGVADQLRGQGIALPQAALDVEQQDLCWQLHGQQLKLQQGDEQAALLLQLPARHWAENMHLVASVVLRLLPHTRLIDVVDALAGWQAPTGRMQLCHGTSGCTVLDDSYNANPVSMQAAIDTLVAMPGHSIAVLGDMAELGVDSSAAHAALNITDVDRVYLVGSQMLALAAHSPDARWYPDQRAMVASLRHEIFAPQDVVLVKGSRCMALDTVVALLCAPQNREVQHAV